MFKIVFYVCLLTLTRAGKVETFVGRHLKRPRGMPLALFPIAYSSVASRMDLLELP